ncbi:Ig-like domain-containing protein [Pseudomonas fulva]|uniref:Ig-like domain-containing protein n=1 Tax=Pseudomonas TaxID=286 RepID=UPI000EE086A1|nr:MULTISPECIES: Ig-like domain-containing protein [Pseudomonas]MCY4123931.1 Ig-like domain-containing protein [Pseudomonas sp.]MBN6790005.1 Ig-like domain-containing protein [Pseudomonas fulva]MBN6795178.1 Ig-like domain-containing protein [Pseudomonas fulva]MBN6855838.1 Ig-like domain-containing protein [Pseudomonas fulva]MBN6873096.1 Ig-like domain-containing protein [Pseudomonas fulva]
MSNLNTPTSDHAIAGWLNPDRLPAQGAAVDIQLDAMYAGKELTVVLAKVDGTKLASKSLPVNYNDQLITLRFPKQLFAQGSGKLKVYYTVGQDGPSAALEFGISDGFTGSHEVDFSAQRLPVFLHNGKIKLPKQLPAQMKFARPLLGATGYKSSDASVATVDGAGNIGVLRNGSTTITATLASGSTEQYQLTVTGLVGLEILAASSTRSSAEKLCKSLGMRMPSKSDFILFKNVYGDQLGQWLPDLAIWGETIGADSAWTFHPHTGVITGESSKDGVLRQAAGIN